MNTVEKIREFTDNDWYEFAGAECFTSAKNPFIYRSTLNDGLYELALVADKNGFELMLTSEEEQLMFIKSTALNYSLVAQSELERLVTQIEHFTYAPDLVYALVHPTEKILEGFILY